MSHTFILSTYSFYKNTRKRGGNGSTSSMLILHTIMGLHMQYLSASGTAKDSNNVFTQRQGGNIIEGKYHSYSREQLINLRPGFNTRLLNTEQVTKINEYGLK